LLTGFCLGWGPTGVVAADSAYYDTAWSFTYDGGLTKDGDPIRDSFRDVKILPNGDAICVGGTWDSVYYGDILLMQLNPEGGVVRKKLFTATQSLYGTSILISKRGEFVISGDKVNAPYLVRLDQDWNIKSESWYYDSIAHKHILLRAASLQSLVETRDGRFVATGGDLFPDRTNNYAVWMEYDSLGALTNYREWINHTGYEIAGWSIAEKASGDFFMGGKQTVAYMDSIGVRLGENKYTFFLTGVGTETNNVTRVRKLRDGRFIVVGQAYEEDCWTRYHQLFYDGWWSILTPTGGNRDWNTAGKSGVNDNVYDATQLVDGRIVLIGQRGSQPSYGLWVMVTDTSAKNIEWEGNFNLPGKSPSGDNRTNLVSTSVAATPDSGFIVVGYEGAAGNDNAFAFKFIPTAKPTSNLPHRTGDALAFDGVHQNMFVYSAPPGEDVALRLYDWTGREAARVQQRSRSSGHGRFDLAPFGLKRGVYLWELRGRRAVARGTLVRVE
jgi:hypothetical protein